MRVKLDEDERRMAGEQLFETAGDPVADIAWAGFVYSFVPYLGILFTPVAVIFGVIDILRAKRRGDPTRRPLRGLAIAIVLGVVQIFLWYLLFAVPKLGRII